MILALVQARMGSERLPGKVLKSIAGRPLLAHLLDRLTRARRLDSIVVATSDQPENRILLDFCRDAGVPAFAGSETDVLRRFAGALEGRPARAVVRITADCPLVDPEIVDALVEAWSEGRGAYSYVTNACLADYRIADGTDVEVFSAELIRRLDTNLKDPFWREWFTPYVQENPERFTARYVQPPVDQSQTRLTVDYPEDLVVVEQILLHFRSIGSFGHVGEILEYLNSHPHLQSVNKSHKGASLFRYHAARESWAVAGRVGAHPTAPPARLESTIP